VEKLQVTVGGYEIAANIASKFNPTTTVARWISACTCDSFYIRETLTVNNTYSITV